MNIEGSFQHILTDFVAFALTGLAGVVILVTGFDRADPIAALFVAAFMLRAAIGLLRDSGRVLLEIAPAHLDVDEVGRAMARHPHVTEVHDLHVWEIGSGFPALSAHVLVEPDADCHGLRRELEAMLDRAVRARPHDAPGRPRRSRRAAADRARARCANDTEPGRPEPLV